MLIKKEDILQFIPQRTPFVMIDSLKLADETGFTSVFKIQADNIFLEDGWLSESALIENIAQTCAAGFGYMNSQKGEKAGGLGFIGAVSRLKLKAIPQQGDQIDTKIKILNTFDNIHLVQGTALKGVEELLDCQLKIVLA